MCWFMFRSSDLTQSRFCTKDLFFALVVHALNSVQQISVTTPESSSYSHPRIKQIYKEDLMQQSEAKLYESILEPCFSFVSKTSAVP